MWDEMGRSGAVPILSTSSDLKESIKDQFFKLDVVNVHISIETKLV